MKSIFLSVVGVPVAVALLCFHFSTPVLAASPVWEMKKGDSVAWLGGTCHVLRASDYPLPAAFDRAYGQAEVVVLETDIEELNSPEAQGKMMGALLYPDGRTLADELSPGAVKALQAYCEKAGIPIAALYAMKPPLVVLTLLALELQKIGVTGEGVDHFFHRKAKIDGRRIEGLESVDAQIGFLAAMGKGGEDELIEQSLAELDQIGALYREIQDAWRQGDEKELLRLLVAEMRRDYPDIYRTLIVERNARWLMRIEELLATPEKELVLVGAAHLVGPDGLVAELKKRGYAVRQLD